MTSTITTTITTNSSITLNNDDDEDPSSVPPPLDINTCTDVTSLSHLLQHLHTLETASTNRLQTLLSTQPSLTHTLSRLDLIRAQLGPQIVSARTLRHSVLSSAASTASRLTTAVHRLDTQQARVRATLAVVDQVAELKACVLGVVDSMGAPQDWETAATYLHRASAIPDEIIKGSFAEEIVPSAEVPDLPGVTLENAAEGLCKLFLREFEAAVERGDGEGVTRFFKLFPLIGRAHMGLEVYGRYVCGGVSNRARQTIAVRQGQEGGREDFFYSTAMTRLFEHIATIVEQHGMLVDRHYGEGKMVKVVERLQVEADTQGGIIIDTFMDERNVERKLTNIKSYAFSFLVQSFLGNQGRTPLGGPPRSNSPAPGGGGTQYKEEDDDGGIDVKEVDLLLTEIGVMLSRWSLYCRFLTRKTQPAPSSPQPGSPPPILRLPSVILNSNLSTKIQDRLITPFNTMSTFFCRRSVEKAFQLDEAPTDLSLSLSAPPSRSSNPPFITSAVDDVMYIVNKLLSRALETSQRALVGAVVATVARVLGSDFVGMIQRKMRDESYPRAAVTGGTPPDDKVLSFLVLLNSLDTAAEYNKRIIDGLTGTGELADMFPFEDDATYVRNVLRNMENTFEAKTGELVGDGVMVVFNQVIKLRLRPLLTETWRDIDYEPLSNVDRHDDLGTASDDEDASADAVKNRFTTLWAPLLPPLKRILTERVFHRLLHTTAVYLSKLLEKRIWTYSGRVNELGAIRLERDVAAVVGVVVRDGRYGIRDVFARCLQICLVVNMEEDEVREMMHDDDGGGGVEWKLEKEEKLRARNMIVVKE